MAALTANVVNPPRQQPGSPKFEGTYKATGADEYYLGAIVCETAGKALLTNLDAAFTLGFCQERVTIAAADEPVIVAVLGVWWVTGASTLADADLRGVFGPEAGSDNPADLIVQTTSKPGALGKLIHVDVTGTSGWLNLGDRTADANA